MIPEFGPGGLLLPNEQSLPYQCTLEEVERRLVTDMGSPAWRVRLFQGWATVRSSVHELVPTARWWLWGCFVSNHPDPLWGSDEVLSSLVILPADEMPEAGIASMLISYLQLARTEDAVDAAWVVDFPNGSEESLDTIEAIEFKWRPRAAVGIADHSSMELSPAGYLEIR
jgi:hypothetical protein